MKKDFFKKLAFVLAATMVIPSAIPAASGSAAAAPNFAKRQANVYDGKSYSYTVKNVPKGGSVKWSVTGTGKSYVKLSKTTGKTVKVTVKTSGKAAAKNAAAKVQAKVYNKSKKLVKTVGDAVKVKISATAVSIGVQKDVDVKAIPANTAVKFSRKLTPANATSLTYWSVVDASGSAIDVAKASIDNKGNFTAKEQGTYTVKADTKNAKTGKVVASATLEVNVGNKITSAAQKSATKVELNFASAPESPKATDFVITNDDTKLVVAVKSVSVDSTKKVVTLETFTEMKDGKAYTVTYKDMKAQFTATDGVVVSVNVNPITVTKASETTVNGQLVDANGVVVKEFKLGSAPSEVEFTVEPTNGYVSDDKLYLTSIGDTAKAKIVYHTYKWDASGNETGKIEKEFTITAVEDASTVSNFKFTIDSSTPNWNTLTETKSTVAVDEESKAYFFFKDSNDTDVTNKYKVSSNDTSKILIDEKTLDGKTDGVKITGIAAGSAYIIVKDSNDKIVTSLLVNVTAKKKATNLVLGATSFTLSNVAATNDTKEVSLKLMDQYGKELEIKTIKVDVTSAPSTATKSAIAAGTEYTISVSDSKVTFTGKNGEFATAPGTYGFKITAEDAYGSSVSRPVTVIIKNPGTPSTASHELVLEGLDANGKFDLKVADGTASSAYASNKELTIKVAAKSGGALVDNVTINSITVKNTSGTDKGAAIAVDKKSATVTLTSVSANVVTKVLPKGTYRVEVKYASYSKGTEATIVKTFEVVDTQAAPVAEILKTDLTNSGLADITSALADTSVIKFTYQGEEVASPNAKPDFDTTKYIGNQVFVKNVIIQVPVSDTLSVEVSVPLNGGNGQTFRFDSEQQKPTP